ncbi:MAG: TRAM domain-containing protein [Bifidobacteriaceae bacterium]|jgi:tRNA/tmRNA/rRNA uracil-C5-methylase (TrmA/RlmC/RlmD family)|nr:TRAM domain-containing protein [Bifidobacteriaceae bacterium]
MDLNQGSELQESSGLVLTAGQWGNGGICASRQGEGPVVLVSGAIPGERVEVRVTERRRQYWRAEVRRVLEASPDRIEPLWPEGVRVGAAGLGYVRPDKARAAKTQVLRDQLGHTAGLEPKLVQEVVPVDDGSGLNWRTKVELTVGSDGRAGMKRPRSTEVVPLKALPLAVPAVEALGLLERTWPAGVRLTAVAPSVGKAFYLVDGKPSGRRRQEKVATPAGECSYELAGTGFWQAHQKAPEVLIRAVWEALEPQPGQAIWDLYAGAGLFTLPLAAAGVQVTAVESSSAAIADLRRNARTAGWSLGGAHRAEVLVALRRGIGGSKPDGVVLDPPRSGAGQGVCAALADAGPERIAYVSCEPSALARDLRYLQDAGYRVRSVQAFDLFPATPHLEAIALLTR